MASALRFAYWPAMESIMIQRRTPRGIRYSFALGSIALYIVACALPAAYHMGFKDYIESDGASLLAFGWMSFDFLLLPWISNFLWFAGLLLLSMNRPKLGWICSAIGLLFASIVLLPNSDVKFLEAAYWWLASQAVLVIVCAVSCIWQWTTPLAADDLGEH